MSLTSKFEQFANLLNDKNELGELTKGEMLEVCNAFEGFHSFSLCTLDEEYSKKFIKMTFQFLKLLRFSKKYTQRSYLLKIRSSFKDIFILLQKFHLTQLFIFKELKRIIKISCDWEDHSNVVILKEILKICILSLKECNSLTTEKLALVCKNNLLALFSNIIKYADQELKMIVIELILIQYKKENTIFHLKDFFKDYNSLDIENKINKCHNYTIAREIINLENNYSNIFSIECKVIFLGKDVIFEPFKGEKTSPIWLDFCEESNKISLFIENISDIQMNNMGWEYISFYSHDAKITKNQFIIEKNSYQLKLKIKSSDLFLNSHDDNFKTLNIFIEKSDRAKELFSTIIPKMFNPESQLNRRMSIETTSSKILDLSHTSILLSFIESDQEDSVKDLSADSKKLPLNWIRSPSDSYILNKYSNSISEQKELISEGSLKDLKEQLISSNDNNGSIKFYDDENGNSSKIEDIKCNNISHYSNEPMEICSNSNNNFLEFDPIMEDDPIKNEYIRVEADSVTADDVRISKVQNWLEKTFLKKTDFEKEIVEEKETTLKQAKILKENNKNELDIKNNVKCKKSKSKMKENVNPQKNNTQKCVKKLKTVKKNQNKKKTVKKVKTKINLNNKAISESNLVNPENDLSLTDVSDGNKKPNELLVNYMKENLDLDASQKENLLLIPTKSENNKLSEEEIVNSIREVNVNKKFESTDSEKLNKLLENSKVDLGLTNNSSVTNENIMKKVIELLGKLDKILPNTKDSLVIEKDLKDIYNTGTNENVPSNNALTKKQDLNTVINVNDKEDNLLKFPNNDVFNVAITKNVSHSSFALTEKTDFSIVTDANDKDYKPPKNVIKNLEDNIITANMIYKLKDPKSESLYDAVKKRSQFGKRRNSEKKISYKNNKKRKIAEHNISFSGVFEKIDKIATMSKNIPNVLDKNKKKEEKKRFLYDPNNLSYLDTFLTCTEEPTKSIIKNDSIITQNKVKDTKLYKDQVKINVDTKRNDYNNQKEKMSKISKKDENSETKIHCTHKLSFSPNTPNEENNKNKRNSLLPFSKENNKIISISKNTKKSETNIKKIHVISDILIKSGDNYENVKKIRKSLIRKLYDFKKLLSNKNYEEFFKEQNSYIELLSKLKNRIEMNKT